MVKTVATDAANIHDSVGVIKVFENVLQSKYDEPNLQYLFADSGCSGKLKQ